MTEDERAAGRWQGNISAQVSSLTSAVSRLESKVDDLTLKSAETSTKQGIMWAAMAATAMMAAGAVFKLFTTGGLG